MHTIDENPNQTGRDTKRGKRRRRMILLCVLLALAVFIAAELCASKYALSVSRYELESEKLSGDIRIVELADLHNSVFGADNRRLIETVQKQEPDLICIAGDLVDSDSQQTDIAVGLIEALTAIAPVYVSLGNQEVELTETFGTDITALYEAAGARVLDYAYEEIEVNGQTIRLGGIYGLCTGLKESANEEEYAFVSGMQDTQLFTLLLCHLPTSWMGPYGISVWEIDCVLAGHIHGGQIILPGIGGLWAPDYGFFPSRLDGVFDSDDGRKAVVVTRGLGSTETIPRFHNIPEVLVLDLKPS